MSREADSELLELLQRARHDRDARGELLDRYRDFLRIVARRELDSVMRPRVDASDIVQNTMIDADRDFEDFRGGSVGEFAAWLVQIHRHRIINEAVRQRAKKRDAQRQRQLPSPRDSTALCWHEPAANASSPLSHFVKDEAALSLASMLEQLPEGQREAVRLRHLEGWSLSDIAEHLGKSVPATAGLVKRGLQNLRERMARQGSSII